MPLKRTVLPLLDRIEPLVTEVGAANTVVFAAAQRLGYNTDVAGMVGALAEHGIEAGQPESRSGSAGPALILGGGATACAALAALRDLGERSAAVAVRDPARAGDLLAAADRLGMAVALRPLESSTLAGARLIISTVPASAADFAVQIFAQLVPAPRLVFDVVYHPWPTALAAAATQAGAVVVGGFDLLLHQAARQVELMTGRPAPVDDDAAGGPGRADQASRPAGSVIRRARGRRRRRSLLRRGRRGLAAEGDAMVPRPALVLLHGGPGADHSLFKPEFSAIADAAQVIYLDQRGSGRSDRSEPGKWTWQRWADDAAACCRALDVRAFALRAFLAEVLLAVKQSGADPTAGVLMTDPGR